MDRQSSDEVAALASDMMNPNIPMLSDEVLNSICDRVRSAAAANAPEEEMRDMVRVALGDFLRDVRRLAASVVSQADGRE